MEVKIYALVDPITCKIRYIGRTSVKLSNRLSQHIHRAKYDKAKTHKEDWIRSLLKINCRPWIRQLCVIHGWEESYEFEVALIEKYRDRLTNFYDKGQGALRECRDEDKLKISNTLKLGYSQGTIERPKGKNVYVYNKDGSFYNEYPSIQEASRQLEVYFSIIKRHLNGKISPKNTPTKDGRKRFIRGNYQYSPIKVEKMHDFTS